MQTATVIVGGGQAGLAMSRCLTERSVPHVVLERGEVANSWRTERWPGLRLLTPNWLTRLPGLAYMGEDPDGYQSASEVARFISCYAHAIDAPVQAETTVLAVRGSDGGYEVVTDQGTWRAPTVVLASGACNVPVVPAFAEEVPADVRSLTPASYRGPDELPERGVLVVGASATGVQLAQEIRRSGRPVTLAVGEHVRLPRVYRGRDIFWWMDAAGVLDEGYREMNDLVRARNIASPQLVGSADRSSVDLNSLREAGVRLVGRLGALAGGVAHFSGSLPNLAKLADLKMNRLLGTLDEWAAASGQDDRVDGPHRFEPTCLDPTPTLAIDLRNGEIGTVVWATGYRPDYSWLDLPVLDRRGYIRHDGGVVSDTPGLYVLGLPFLRRRSSSFITGTGADAVELAADLHSRLAAR